LALSPIGFLQKAPSVEAKQWLSEAILAPKLPQVPSLIWEMWVPIEIVI